MSSINYESYVKEQHPKPKRNVINHIINQRQTKYFLLCGKCLWMASTIPTLSDLCLIRHKKCPICVDRVYRFLICDDAV